MFALMWRSTCEPPPGALRPSTPVEVTGPTTRHGSDLWLDHWYWNGDGLGCQGTGPVVTPLPSWTTDLTTGMAETEPIT